MTHREWTVARMLETPAQAERIDVLARKIEPYLAGEHPAVVGAVLGELLAMWLAGHQVSADEHAEMIARHIRLVLDLLPVEMARIREKQ